MISAYLFLKKTPTTRASGSITEVVYDELEAHTLAGLSSIKLNELKLNSRFESSPCSSISLKHICQLHLGARQPSSSSHCFSTVAYFY